MIRAQVGPYDEVPEPKMSDLLEQTMPGWRRDPSGRYEWRWWDGNGWTNRVANSAPGDPGASSPAPPPAPADPPAPPAGPPASGAAAAAVAAPAAAPAPAPSQPAAVGDPFAALRAPRNSSPMPEPSALAPSPRTVAGLRLAAAVRARGGAPDRADLPVGARRHVGQQVGRPLRARGRVRRSRPRRRQAGPVGRAAAAVAGFFRSFWEQEESYHSPSAGVGRSASPEAAMRWHRSRTTGAPAW